MTARWMRWTAVSAAALAVAGCSDSSGPQDKGFDTRRVKDGVAVVEQVSAAPVLQSFRALGAEMGGSGISGSPAAERLMGAIQDLGALTLGNATGAQLVPVIRQGILGKTLVFDPAAGKYVVDPARAGAPANGVRFILYETVEGGQPNPAKEVGFADLTDEKAGAANAAGLRFRVVSGDEVYLDYNFEVSGSIGAAQVKIKGFMADEEERVNFEIATTGQLFGRGGTNTLDATLEVPSHNFKIVAKLSGPAGEAPGTSQVELRVTAGSDVLVINATSSPSEVDARITVNGKLFATAKGNPTNPVIRGEGGRELTADELQALGAIVKFAQGVFEVLVGLLAPAGALLLIGLGL